MAKRSKPKAKAKPEVVEQFKLFLDYFEDMTCIKADREDHEEDITFVPRKFTRSRDLIINFATEEVNVPKELFDSDNLFMIVVRYSNGDTFGRTHGHWHIELITSDRDEAYRLEALINKQGGDYESRDAYSPWQGYFARFSSVELHVLSVVGEKSNERTD